MKDWNKLSPGSCSGLAGVWNKPQAAAEVFFLLHNLQHRGSDGAGIAAGDGKQVHALKAHGLLSETLPAERLSQLSGSLAIGQVRMASAMDAYGSCLQPFMVRAYQGSFALVCTGLIANAPSLRASMEAQGLVFTGTSDAEIIAHLIQLFDGSLKEKIGRACQAMKGAYTFLLMSEKTMYAVNSAQSIHSLYYVKDGESILFASETCALSQIGSGPIHKVEPGQMIVLGKSGMEIRQFDAGFSHPCSMETVYYSREDSLFAGCSVHKLRQQAGVLLAKREQMQADIVIGVPDTALAAASAFARETGLPWEMGLIKNRYIGSTFVRPTRTQREKGMRVRLNASSSIVKGKRVFLVDDSIRKGATARRLCTLLREAGALEIHLRIASPRIAWPCLHGMEGTERSDLCAARYTDEELCELFQADSLSYLSAKEFASILPEKSCMACMSGHDCVEVGDYEILKEKGEGNCDGSTV